MFRVYGKQRLFEQRKHAHVHSHTLTKKRTHKKQANTKPPTNTRTNTHTNLHVNLTEHTRKKRSQVGVPASVTHWPLPQQSADHTAQSLYTTTRANTYKFTNTLKHTRKTFTRRHASECDALAIARAVSGAHRTLTIGPVEAG